MVAQWLGLHSEIVWRVWGKNCFTVPFRRFTRKTLLQLLKLLYCMTCIINVKLVESEETIQTSYCESTPDTIKDKYMGFGLVCT